MKSRWDEGIRPRNFHWVVKDRLAVAERPGGYAGNHRKVRRQEEIIWLRENGFTRVVSLLVSPHNLHAYDELDMAWSHLPIAPGAKAGEALARLYTKLDGWLAAGEIVLVHQDEMGDRVVGVAAGYLVWSRTVPAAPLAITALERIVGRQMGPAGRELVALAARLAPGTGAAPPAR